MRLWLLVLLLSLGAWGQPAVVVGSKAFPESWILGECLTELGQQAGPVTHRRALGTTQIAFAALKQGAIDVYPDYTGTVAEVLLKEQPNARAGDLIAAMAEQGIGLSYPLGFNDGYAVAIAEPVARRLSLAKVSDLSRHPEVRLALSSEIMARSDGWHGLQQKYGLDHQSVVEMQHELAYTALQSGRIDGMVVYTTDAQLQRLQVTMLEDDRGFFRRYDAVLLYRVDLPQRAPAVWAAMQRLVGRIDEKRMLAANAMVTVEHKTEGEAADFLLKEVMDRSFVAPPSTRPSWTANLSRNVGRHLVLVAGSLSLAIALGIPLGILASRSRALGTVTLSGIGLLQTIPSLALLAFLVPWLGIGWKPAVVALFVYSLLPIVRNTYTGLTTIPANLSEAAQALGLSSLAQLVQIRLPMASRSIMAGIKTSAVINVGTATLAALIGAGGLGEPILQGIALVDRDLIFQGALPAAGLALSVQWLFDLLERLLVPRGLRL